MPKYLSLKRRARAPARARRDLPAAVTAYAEAARRGHQRRRARRPGPPGLALGPAELYEGRLTERRPPGQRHLRTTTPSSTNP
jgi:hypothetical protein